MKATRKSTTILSVTLETVRPSQSVPLLLRMARSAKATTTGATAGLRIPHAAAILRCGASSKGNSSRNRQPRRAATVPIMTKGPAKESSSSTEYLLGLTSITRRPCHGRSRSIRRKSTMKLCPTTCMITSCRWSRLPLLHPPTDLRLRGCTGRRDTRATTGYNMILIYLYAHARIRTHLHTPKTDNDPSVPYHRQS